MDSVITLQQVTKHYGHTTILDQLELAIPKGSIFGFVGKNGAGKTTTMRLILGLEAADKGTIDVLDHAISFGYTYALGEIGYVPDVPTFYSYLTATEYLTLCGQISGMKTRQLKEQIPQLLATVGLDSDRKKIKGYSRGMKQRLAIAQGLLGDPKILICDEPTSALDPKGREEILMLLASLSPHTTVIFSTHILEDVERICDQVAMLDRGKIVCHGNLQQLKQAHQQKRVEVLIPTTQIKQWELALQTLDSQNIKSVQNEQVVSLSYQTTSEQFLSWFLVFVQQHQLYFESYQLCRSSLEQLFLEVTA